MMESYEEDIEYDQIVERIFARLPENYAAKSENETVSELVKQISEDDRNTIRSIINEFNKKEFDKLCEFRVSIDPLFLDRLQRSELDPESKMKKLAEYKEEIFLKEMARRALVLRICYIARSARELFNLEETLKKKLIQWHKTIKLFVHQEATNIQNMMASSAETAEFRQKAGQRTILLLEKYAVNITNETIPELMEKLSEEDRTALQNSIQDIAFNRRFTRKLELRAMCNPEYYFQLKRSELDIEKQVEKMFELLEEGIKESARNKIIIRILEIVNSERKNDRVW